MARAAGWRAWEERGWLTVRSGVLDRLNVGDSAHAVLERKGIARPDAPARHVRRDIGWPGDLPELHLPCVPVLACMHVKVKTSLAALLFLPG